MLVGSTRECKSSEPRVSAQKKGANQGHPREMWYLIVGVRAEKSGSGCLAASPLSPIRFAIEAHSSRLADHRASKHHELCIKNWLHYVTVGQYISCARCSQRVLIFQLRHSDASSGGKRIGKKHGS